MATRSSAAIAGREEGLAELDGLRPVGYDKIEPSAPGAMRALRRLGYTLGEAVADIIDNSIDAGAKDVLVRFIYTADAVARVVIADNGRGMSDDVLLRGMQFGAEQNHSEDDLGKYGMGLKLASFSQCRCLSVASRQSGKVTARQWTEKDINRGWYSARLDPKVADKFFSRSWGKVKIGRTGTLIIWDELDRMEPTDGGITGYLHSKQRNLGLYLGVVFHRLLAKKKIRIHIDAQKVTGAAPTHDITVEPVDPFGYNEPGNRHYPREFQLSMGRLGKVVLKAHIWPARAKGVEYSLGGAAAAAQGFYFYRNDRLIQRGGWNNLRGQDDEPHLTLARVEVDIPPRLDSEFALQTQKSGVDVPDQFLEAVRTARSGKLTFSEFITDAQAAYRKSPEKDLPFVPGKGFPKRVQSRSAHVLVEDRRIKKFARVRIQWKALQPGEFFELDRQARTIFLNASYRSGIANARNEDGALFKTILFLLVKDDIQRKKSQKRELWLSACNQLLAAAFQDS